MVTGRVWGGAGGGGGGWHGLAGAQQQGQTGWANPTRRACPRRLVPPTAAPERHVASSPTRTAPPHLADAVHARDRLLLHRGVERRLQQHDAAGGGQRQPRGAGAQRQQEHAHLGAARQGAGAQGRGGAGLQGCQE
jgi:hypothetical protein